MVNRDLEKLCGDLTRVLQAQTKQELDAIACEKARDWIGKLEGEISAVESRLSLLGGFFSDDLAGALVGAMGLDAHDLHSRVPALRKAVVDLEGES